MLQALHVNKRVQLVLGLVTGILFGFLLQKSGVTYYDVILNQLLLTDFTVVKVMLSAVVVGMVGVHLLRSLGVVRLHPKPGSVGKTIYDFVGGDFWVYWASRGAIVSYREFAHPIAFCNKSNVQEMDVSPPYAHFVLMREAK